MAKVKEPKGGKEINKHLLLLITRGNETEV